MISIIEHTEGSLLAVRVQPGARKTCVKGEHAGALKLAVCAPPEDGKANAAVIELLAELLEVKRNQVELVSGPTNRSKKFLIRGVTPDNLERQLEALLQ
ncbi:hypothetical protein BH10PLA2_BH10PLA2_08710 [soil metagenome]